MFSWHGSVLVKLLAVSMAFVMLAALALAATEELDERQVRDSVWKAVEQEKKIDPAQAVQQLARDHPEHSHLSSIAADDKIGEKLSRKSKPSKLVR